MPALSGTLTRAAERFAFASVAVEFDGTWIDMHGIFVGCASGQPVTRVTLAASAWQTAGHRVTTMPEAGADSLLVYGVTAMIAHLSMSLGQISSISRPQPL